MALISIAGPVFTKKKICTRSTRGSSPRACHTIEMVFVDDGSSDGSAQILGKVAPHDPHVCVVHLSRNFGYHPASTAAVRFSSGDAVVLMPLPSGYPARHRLDLRSCPGLRPAHLTDDIRRRRKRHTPWEHARGLDPGTRRGLGRRCTPHRAPLHCRQCSESRPRRIKGSSPRSGPGAPDLQRRRCRCRSSAGEANPVSPHASERRPPLAPPLLFARSGKRAVNSGQRTEEPMAKARRKARGSARLPARVRKADIDRLLAHSATPADPVPPGSTSPAPRARDMPRRRLSTPLDRSGAR